MTAQSTHPEPRWRRLPEERPGQIIAAALAVFGEHGLAAARLDDIARRAGLSKGTIYLYFPNKEELFREVVRQTVVRQIEAGERSLEAAPASAAETLGQFARNYWTFIRSPEFAPIFRLVYSEMHAFPDLARFYAEEVVARGHRLIMSVVQQGVSSGEFRLVDPGVAARMLTAPIMMHGLWCTHRECFPSVATRSDEQVIEELVQFYLAALRPHASNGSRRAAEPRT